MTVHYVELQDRKRANLAHIAKHDAYLVREEPDGTLIWEPATVITQAERRLLQDAALVAQVTRTRRNGACGRSGRRMGWWGSRPACGAGGRPGGSALPRSPSSNCPPRTTPSPLTVQRKCGVVRSAAS
jgi:hypothetical protein